MAITGDASRRLAVKPTLGPVEPTLLEDQVYRSVLGAILSGELLPGFQLVEARLAAQLGVSKTPVREALIRLERDGLAEASPFRGARVVSPSLHDAHQICELRTWIESAIVRQVAEAPPKGLLCELERNLELTRRAIRDQDRPATIRLLLEFAQLLWRTSPNRYAYDVLTRLQYLAMLVSQVSREVEGRDDRSLSEHGSVVAAIATGDPDAAEKAVRLHMKSVERDYALGFELVGGSDPSRSPYGPAKDSVARRTPRA